MKNYTVALVYTRLENGKVDIALRQSIIKATNENEALGIIINELHSKMFTFSLSAKNVIEIPEA
jgi:hypothetical protein